MSSFVVLSGDKGGNYCSFFRIDWKPKDLRCQLMILKITCTNQFWYFLQLMPYVGAYSAH